MEVKRENKTTDAVWSMPDLQSCLFAHTPDSGMTIGVVSSAEPSSLALLAAGVSGMAARRARRERTK